MSWDGGAAPSPPTRLEPEPEPPALLEMLSFYTGSVEPSLLGCYKRVAQVKHRLNCCTHPMAVKTAEWLHAGGGAGRRPRRAGRLTGGRAV